MSHKRVVLLGSIPKSVFLQARFYVPQLCVSAEDATRLTSQKDSASNRECH